jgi:glycosyltransferase involved in cell wall biosynthesis
VRFDVDGPLPELVPFREGAPSYVGAWVIVLRDGRPLGHLEVTFHDQAISPARLRELVVAALGDVWAEPVTVSPTVGLPLVSVVVPSTFERVELLERCVASLVAQDYPSFEVVVVDNRPDGSVERAEFYRRLRAERRVSVVAEPRRGISPARNCGVALAVGEIVAFTDDDVEVESGWLRAIGSRFALEPQTDCVTGLVLPTELETPAQIWFERSGSSLDQHYQTTTFTNDGSWRGKSLGGLRRGRFEVTARRPGAPDETFLMYRSGKFGMGASMAVRASALRSAGAFDEALGAGSPTMAGEDHALLIAILFGGGRVTLDPAAFVFHTHRRTLAELEHQMRGYGRGYTAMLAATVWGSRAHLAGLFWYALQGLVLIPRKFAGRRDDTSPTYPKELSRAEFRGLVSGPWVFLASVRTARHRRRQQVEPRTPRSSVVTPSGEAL